MPQVAHHVILATSLNVLHVPKVYNFPMEFVFPAPITVNSAMEEYAQLVPLASKLTQQVSVFLNAKQHAQPVLIINQVSAFLAIVVQITIVLQILAHWISLVTVTLPALTVETDLTIF